VKTVVGKHVGGCGFKSRPLRIKYKVQIQRIWAFVFYRTAGLESRSARSPRLESGKREAGSRKFCFAKLSVTKSRPLRKNKKRLYAVFCFCAAARSIASRGTWKGLVYRSEFWVYRRTKWDTKPVPIL